MSMLRKLLIVATMTSTVLAFPALISGASAVENGTVYVLEPNGTMLQAKIKPGGMQAFMAKKPKRVSKRMLVMMMDGKFYMVQDASGDLTKQWLETRDAISH
jgi:hypothetical protein